MCKAVFSLLEFEDVKELSAPEPAPPPPCWQRLGSLCHLPPLSSGHPLSDYVTSPRATGLTHLPSAMTGAARVRCLCPSSSEVAPLEPMCTEAALGTCVDTPPAGHPCSGLTSEDQKHASWSQGLPACLAACFVGSYLPPIPASCFPSAENLVCFAARRPPVLVVAGFLNRTQTH